MADIERTGAASNELSQFEEFENTLLLALQQIGLPGTGVLVDLDERHQVFTNFQGAIARLDDERRADAMYLSKMLVAVGAGLFDAALNYLWDETISELRRRVAMYDLAYFFDIAISSTDRRKSLRDETHLAQVSDHELINGARDIGLISSIGFQQLDLIRYMRNYASAAHPNQNDVDAFQLLGWITTCIKEVITLPESAQVAETKRLLSNVRKGAISSENALATAEFFSELKTESADNLAAGLFGIYLEDDSGEQARDGVRLLMPKLWTHVSDKQRYDFGIKHANHVANADFIRANRAREVLDVVNGTAYLTDGVRSVELKAAIDDLLAAHRGFDNFYAETRPSKHLNDLSLEPVPESTREMYVSGVVEAFLTNGNGVAWAADVNYRSMIARFGPREAEIALLTLFDEAIASKLRWFSSKQQFAELLTLVEAKITSPAANDLLTAIRGFPGGADKISIDSDLNRLANRLRN